MKHIVLPSSATGKGAIKNAALPLLDCVDGIGRKKRRQLIVYFGGLNGVIAAGEEELAKIEGIGGRLAERIYRMLH